MFDSEVLGRTTNSVDSDKLKPDASVIDCSVVENEALVVAEAIVSVIDVGSRK